MSMDTFADLFATYWPHLVGVLGTGVLGTGGLLGVFAFRRRPRAQKGPPGAYFTHKKLLAPPMTRPAYSDRMAYVLAEMSALAYFEFEGRTSMIDDAVEEALSRNLSMDANVREFLEDFSTEMMSGQRVSLTILERVLENSDFQLLDVINVGSTQGLVCKRTAKGEPPYLVLAFRGTEKKVTDWLTDARCLPTVDRDTKVHTGFLKAFEEVTGESGRTVLETVEEILGRPAGRDEEGAPLPLFITGHSLGGALALVATKKLASNRDGACYTFGGPRIANYEYFSGVKTPVFRVVNSSDIVPRVPPGAGLTLLLITLKGLSSLSSLVPALSSLLDKLETRVDRLKGYRHFGDLRYLTDVAEGRFDTVRLLTAPPAIDRLLWMVWSLRRSLPSAVTSHSISIYRKKLWAVAESRNRT